MTKFDLSIWHGRPETDAVTSRHDELELTCAEKGPIAMEVGAARLRIKSGGVAFFWGLSPHQVIKAGPETLLYVVSIPVTAFVQWRLPKAFTQSVLGGSMVKEDVSMSPRLDRAMFRKWLADFQDTSAEGRKILNLEVEARLRRLARSAGVAEGKAGRKTRRPSPVVKLDHAMVMGRFIAENHTEPLHDSDIARAAHLNAQYAMRLFSKTFGVSMHKYLTNHRVAHARRLLAGTNSKVVDVAFESGFGSVSRFYESFTRACGQSPHNYRVARRREDAVEDAAARRRD